MARAVEAVPEQAEGTAWPCLCESYARVTERSALASARWLGRADQDGALGAACAGMHEALSQLPIDGNIVIGAGEEADNLAAGAHIGSGGDAADLALDPLEGAGIVARGGNGAMSMIASGPRGSFPTLPDMYMRKMAVGPVARGSRGSTTSSRSSRSTTSPRAR
jgi:fructose-1,6-bisphosphatase II